MKNNDIYISTTYTQGVTHDGAVILRDGIRMTPDEIVSTLNVYEQVKHNFIKSKSKLEKEIMERKYLYSQVETHKGPRILCNGEKMNLNLITRTLNEYYQENIRLVSVVNELSKKIKLLEDNLNSKPQESRYVK